MVTKTKKHSNVPTFNSLEQLLKHINIEANKRIKKILKKKVEKVGGKNLNTHRRHTGSKTNSDLKQSVEDGTYA